MNLASLQRNVARAVMTPLTSSERMRRVAPDGRSMRAVAERFIKPNDRLTSFERLEIYNRQYWFRILSAFADDFPGLRAVLGGRRFDALAKAYLTDCPSRSFTLRNLGARLEKWLEKHASWGGARQRLAQDMVRLEWAEIEAFDGEAEPALRPEDVAASGNPQMQLKLQPYVQLLALGYPVDDLLLEVRREGDSDFASNAFSERRKRRRVHAVAKLKPSEIFLAVHRLDDSVYFRRIEREEYAMLKALRNGRTLGQSIEAGLRKSSLPAAERPASVRSWFRNWAALGWFCRPERVRDGACD